eukprot:TRINITY_DN1301_c0_g1_i1.p1 TRINITY_DN1301_c0_g1~~TRINITY_DN1301_c0_g1_i1.p1  ORF type:complete len:877 (+),score=105.54 TRINITY_DN1301_c0_g1_i1:181-2631(+)
MDFRIGTPTEGGRSTTSRPPSGLRSSMRPAKLLGVGGASRAKKANRRISIVEKTVQPEKLLLANGAPPHRQSEGWQSTENDVMSRMGLLFNCHTMSDITFHVGGRQIPAHKFILGCASPVFYAKVVAASRPDSRDAFSVIARSWQPEYTTAGGGGGDITPLSEGSATAAMNVSQVGHLHLAIPYDFEAFFEFLRYLYTDDVVINLKNVMGLITIADEFRINCLVEQCAKFLRTESRSPENALRILRISEGLMCKAVLGYWRDQVDYEKQLSKIREMSMAERRTARAGSALSGRFSAMSSRAGSRASSRRGSEVGSEIGSRAGSLAGSGISEFASLLGSETNSQYVPMVSESNLSSSTLFEQIGGIQYELFNDCWRSIREQTHIILIGDDWIEQPLARIKAVLSIEMCNVPEIVLFRALVDWIEHRCLQEDLPIRPENLRRFADESVLRLVRFPAMKIQELQWEVVPTGLLGYEDIATLQSVLSGDAVSTRFNHEPRDLPAVDQGSRLKQRRFSRLSSPEDKAKAMDDAAMEIERRVRERGDQAVPAKVTYTSVEGDELDALLESRLLRKHVDDVVQDLTNGYLQEPDAEPSAGEERSYSRCESRSESRSGRRSVASVATTSSTMAAARGQQYLRLGPMQSRRERGSTPMLLGTPYSPADHLLAGGARSPTPPKSPQSPRSPRASPRPWSPTSPSPTPRPPSALASSNTAQASGAVKTLRYGSRRLSDVPSPCGFASGKPRPQDFERVQSGVYRFRHNRMLEMKVENGALVIYDNEDGGSCSLSATDLDDGDDGTGPRIVAAASRSRAAISVDAFLQ